MGAYDIHADAAPSKSEQTPAARTRAARREDNRPVRSNGAEIAMLVADLPLFAGLEEKTLRRIARGAREVRAPRGGVLFVPGDACDGMYVIVSGRIKLALPVQGHPEKVIALLGPGATFGETGIFLGEPRIMSAEALRDSVLVHVASEAVGAAHDRDTVFARRLLAALSRRVRELVADMRRTTLDSGTQRTLSFLLDQLAGAASEGRANITLPAKKRLIASRLNLTGEHFSRILHELSSARLIRVDGPTITIPDVGKLRAAAEAHGS